MTLWTWWWLSVGVWAVLVFYWKTHRCTQTWSMTFSSDNYDNRGGTESHRCIKLDGHVDGDHLFQMFEE